MGKLLLRGTGAILCAAMVLGISACGKSKTDSEITGDEFDPGNLIKAGTMPTKLPDDVSWYDYSLAQPIYDHMEKVLGEDWFFMSAACSGGEFYVLGQEDYDYREETGRYIISRFDKDMNPVRDYESPAGYQPNDILVGDKVYVEAFNLGEHEFYKYPVGEDEIDYSSPRRYINKIPSTMEYPIEDYLPVIDPSTGEEKARIDLTSIKQYDVDYVSDAKQIGEDHALICCGGTYDPIDESMNYFIVDINDGSVTPYSEFEFLKGIDPYSLCYVSGRSLGSSPKGIYEIDYDKGETTLVFGSNYSNCNRFVIANSKPLMIDDNRIVLKYEISFYSADYASLSDVTPTSGIYILDRCDSYDQAGKKVISIAAFDEPDYEVAEAICRFNAGSSDAFAVFDDRYCVEIDLADIDYEDLAQLRLNSYSATSDKLAVDLLSGEGPDIILTNGIYDNFNNSNCLLDLGPVADKLDGSSYFSNVISSSKKDGVLYQMPISFSVVGLFSQNGVFDEKDGITFQDYESLVNGYCNGLDPLHSYREDYSRSDVMSVLFRSMHDLFIRDGSIDVNNDQFKAYLDYCKTLPKDPVKLNYDNGDEIDEFLIAADRKPVYYGTLTTFGSYIGYCEQFGKDFDMCGLPSPDGRSSTIIVKRSVCISKAAASPELCKDFIASLLTADTQYGFITYEEIPVCKEALTASTKADLAGIDEEVDWYHYSYDESDVAPYIEMLDRASVGSASDGDIVKIILEEAPAYLEGQKSFEDVASTINNRAQTILDEQP